MALRDRQSFRRGRLSPYVLERSQTIPASIEEVWDFFSNPANLARLTPPGLRFRIHGNPPPSLDAGSRIEYRIRWMFFDLAWVTRISRWIPGAEFEDVQERGPYRRWFHRHRFEARGADTVIRDRVEYELPFGAIGRLAHALFVRRQLEEIFDFRRAAIEEIFRGRTARREGARR